MVYSHPGTGHRALKRNELATTMGSTEYTEASQGVKRAS